MAGMRHAQREYFRTKSKSALNASKVLELHVDQLCYEIICSQQGQLPCD